jgi:hypothetical protein
VFGAVPRELSDRAPWNEYGRGHQSAPPAGLAGRIRPALRTARWHRHAGEWFCLYRALSLAEALDVLLSDELLHPL